jgi:hypothetical protein
MAAGAVARNVGLRAGLHDVIEEVRTAVRNDNRAANAEDLLPFDDDLERTKERGWAGEATQQEGVECEDLRKKLRARAETEQP